MLTDTQKATIRQYKEKHKIYKSFELDRLLKLTRIHALEKYDGHFSIFTFTSGFKMAFGTPSDLYLQLWPMPTFSDLKDAVIFTLLYDYQFPSVEESQKEYDDYLRICELHPEDGYENLTSGEAAREFYITEIA